MINENIDKLIQITEEVIYQNPDSELARNLTNISSIIQPSCCCSPSISGILPSNIIGYGPGMASEIARQAIYRNKNIPKPEFSSGVIR